MVAAPRPANSSRPTAVGTVRTKKPSSIARPVIVCSPAVDRRRTDFVKLLLDRPGADLGLQQEDGATALHIAAAGGDLEIVRLLVTHGADPAARDRNGSIPAEIARSAGHGVVTEYLEGVDEP